MRHHGGAPRRQEPPALPEGGQPTLEE